MRRLAMLAVSVTLSAAADCAVTALQAMGDVGFSWLVRGTSVERLGNITAICASADNTARTNFNTRLTALTADCVPQGTDGLTSPFALTTTLLNSVMCEKRGEVGGEAHFCLLSLLPLFDLAYFLRLQDASFTLPSLQVVGDTPDRQTQMCSSPVCNAFLENSASSVLSALNESAAFDGAKTFIRGIVSRMRCGCAVPSIACESTANTDELTQLDAVGVRTLIESKACDASGVLTACARTWVNCEALPLPACAKTCTVSDLVTINFRIKNLNWECFKAKLGDVTLRAIQDDLIANVPGLLHSDFSCQCAASTAPSTGTDCSCKVTCSALAIVQKLDLAGTLEKFTMNANALVIPTPRIDATAFATCQITPGTLSFGTYFQLLGISTNFPQPQTMQPTTEPDASSSFTLRGLSIAVSLCLSFVL